MKKKAFIIVLLCCCLAAVLISAFYLAPAHSKRPYKNLTREQIETVYVGQNTENTYSEDEIEELIKKLQALKIVKKVRNEDIPQADGFFALGGATVKLTNGKTFNFSDGSDYNGEHYVLLDDICYTVVYN